MHTGDVSFADINADNALDLVIGNVAGGYMQVCLNNGHGIFKEITDQIFFPRIYGEALTVNVADFNADKVPDIYFGMYRNADMLFFGSH
jgi:hypothetical protein